MEEKTYRFTKFGRFGTWLFIIPFTVYLMVSVLYLASPKDLLLRFSVGDYPNIFETIAFLLLAGLMLVVFWLFINMGVFSMKYRIILADAGIQIESFDFWGRKFLNSLNKNYSIGLLPYEEIMSVDADSWRPGIATVTFKDSRSILLTVRSLENYQDFVKQLADRLDYMQVGQGFLKLGQPRRFKRILPVVYTLALLPTVFFAILYNFGWLGPYCME